MNSLEIKTTSEQTQELTDEFMAKEKALGQYARTEIPIRELTKHIHSNKVKWVSVESLWDEISKIHSKHIKDGFDVYKELDSLLNELRGSL